jgi:HAD superfamily hydrolase (TIGR01549 family)
MKPSIRAMLFDFGQTLVDSADGFRAAEKTAKKQLFTHLNASSQTVSWECFVAEYRRIRKAFHDRSHLSRVDIWQAVYHHFGQSAGAERLQQWETAYWAEVKAHTLPFPETLSVLETLARRFVLGLVTNTQGQGSTGTHRLALFPQIEHFFSAIVVAGEHGIAPKPDSAPFLACLAQLERTPAEAIYVGDDWRNDVCGAQNAGLWPVWLKHHAVKRSWPDINANVPVLDSLEGLLSLDPKVDFI